MDFVVAEETEVKLAVGLKGVKHEQVVEFLSGNL